MINLPLCVYIRIYLSYSMSLYIGCDSSLINQISLFLSYHIVKDLTTRVFLIFLRLLFDFLLIILCLDLQRRDSIHCRI